MPTKTPPRPLHKLEFRLLTLLLAPAARRRLRAHLRARRPRRTWIIYGTKTS